MNGPSLCYEGIGGMEVEGESGLWAPLGKNEGERENDGMGIECPVQTSEKGVAQYRALCSERRGPNADDQSACLIGCAVRARRSEPSCLSPRNDANRTRLGLGASKLSTWRSE